MTRRRVDVKSFQYQVLACESGGQSMCISCHGLVSSLDGRVVEWSDVRCLASVVGQYGAAPFRQRVEPCRRHFRRTLWWRASCM